MHARRNQEYFEGITKDDSGERRAGEEVSIFLENT